jgi:capsular exopolysaccharide synthesis family protein
LDLLDVLPVLRRRWRVLVGTVLVALLAAVGYLVATPETYRAQTQVFVATGAGDDAAGLAQATAFALTRVRSYVDLVRSPEITQPVIDELDLALTPEQLAARIQASVPLNTVLVDIAVTGDSAPEATRLAQAVTEEFVDYVTVLEREAAVSRGAPAPDDAEAEPQEAVALTIIHPAQEPDAPVSPKPALTLVLALLAGIIGGAALAVARDRLDTRVRDEDDLGPAAPPVLGSLERLRRRDARTSALADGGSTRAEALRHLRTNLEFLERDRPAQVLAVVSPTSRDGRTTTAADLAAVMAEAGRRTIVVDAALRRPGLAAHLGIDAEAGLGDALAGRPVRELLVLIDEHVAVLPAGHRVPNPGEVLASDRLDRLVDELRALADMVVIDTSPLLESADAATLVGRVDATLLLARVGHTRRADVLQAVERLERVQRPPLGLVLTGVRPVESGYGRYARAPYRAAG